MSANDITLTARSAVWKDLSDILGSMLDDALILVNEDGLHVAHTDPAHVALIVLDVPSSAFEKYEAAGTMVGLDLDNLKSMLLSAGERDVTLRTALDSSGNQLIELSMPGGHAWTFHGIDVGGFTPPRIPDLAPPIRFHLPASFVQDANGIGMCVSDHVVITYHDQEVTLDYRMDGESSTSRFRRTGIVNGRARSSFPLDYLTNFIRAIDREVMLEFLLGNDYPVIVSGETANGVRFQFMLAPRVNERA